MKKTFAALIIGSFCLSLFSSCGKDASNTSAKEPPSSMEEQQSESDDIPETQTSGSASETKSNSTVKTYERLMESLSTSDSFVFNPSRNAVYVAFVQSYPRSSDAESTILCVKMTISLPLLTAFVTC